MGKRFGCCAVFAVLLFWGCSDGLTDQELQKIGDGLPPPTDLAVDGPPINPPTDMGPVGPDIGDDPPGDLQENQVSIETSLGRFVIELNFDAAPISASNFVSYVEGGFYDGSDGIGATVFHFVDPEFSVAGGTFDEQGEIKPARQPIPLESTQDTGLSNIRGAVAMSRIASSPASATGGFFVNVTDNSEESDFLDEGRQGYAVFGRVVQGMDVIDAIAAVAVQPSENPAERRPVVPVLIQRVTRWQ